MHAYIHMYVYYFGLGFACRASGIGFTAGALVEDEGVWYLCKDMYLYICTYVIFTYIHIRLQIFIYTHVRAHMCFVHCWTSAAILQVY